MGTFPPPAKRWAMEFYYPNPTNDFWPMMGLIFMNDRTALTLPDKRGYNLPAIKQLLDQRGIALSDTGYRIRRLAGNASDKHLEIVTPVQLDNLTSRMPQLRAIATTGEKAASIIAAITETAPPKMGEYTQWGKTKLWRMPSTSRAYPLALEKKADYYMQLFTDSGIL